MGGVSPPIGESRVSLFSHCFRHEASFSRRGTVEPLTPTLSPTDLQEAEVFGGEGETHGDLDPGRRAQFLLRALPGLMSVALSGR